MFGVAPMMPVLLTSEMSSVVGGWRAAYFMITWAALMMFFG